MRSIVKDDEIDLQTSDLGLRPMFETLTSTPCTPRPASRCSFYSTHSSEAVLSTSSKQDTSDVASYEGISSTGFEDFFTPGENKVNILFL